MEAALDLLRQVCTLARSRMSLAKSWNVILHVDGRNSHFQILPISESLFNPYSTSYTFSGIEPYANFPPWRFSIVKIFSKSERVTAGIATPSSCPALESTKISDSLHMLHASAKNPLLHRSIVNHTHVYLIECSFNSINSKAYTKGLLTYTSNQSLDESHSLVYLLTHATAESYI
jgi:hypothetical protein